MNLFIIMCFNNESQKCDLIMSGLYECVWGTSVFKYIDRFVLDVYEDKWLNIEVSF